MKILNKSFTALLLLGCSICNHVVGVNEATIEPTGDDLVDLKQEVTDEDESEKATEQGMEIASQDEGSKPEKVESDKEDSEDLILPQSLKEALDELGDPTARIMHPNIGLVVEKIQEICERISETCDDPEAKDISDKIQTYLAQLGQHCLEGEPANYSQQNLDRSLLPTCKELQPLFDQTLALIKLYKDEDPSASRIWHVNNDSKIVKILMGIIKSGEAYRARTPDLSPRLLFVIDPQIKEATLKLRPFANHSKKLRKDFKNQDPNNSLNWLLIMVQDPVFIVKRSNIRLLERAIQAKYEEISVKLDMKPGFEKIRQEYLQAAYALWLYELKVHCMCCIHMHEVVKKFAQARAAKNLSLPKLSDSKTNFMHRLRGLIIQSRGTIEEEDADELIERLTRIQQHVLRGFKDHGIIESGEILEAWKTTAKRFSETRVSKSLYTLYRKYKQNLEKIEANKKQAAKLKQTHQMKT